MNFVVVGANASQNAPTPTVSPTADITIPSGGTVSTALTFTDLLGQVPTVPLPFSLTLTGTNQYTLTSTALTAATTATITADNGQSDPLSQAINILISASAPVITPAANPINIDIDDTLSVAVTITNRNGLQPFVLPTTYVITQVSGDNYLLTSNTAPPSGTATITMDNGVDAATSVAIPVNVNAVPVFTPATTAISVESGDTISTTINIDNRGGRTPTINSPFIITSTGGDDFAITSTAITTNTTAVVTFVDFFGVTHTQNIAVTVTSGDFVQIDSTTHTLDLNGRLITTSDRNCSTGTLYTGDLIGSMGSSAGAIAWFSTITVVNGAVTAWSGEARLASLGDGTFSILAPDGNMATYSDVNLSAI